MTKNTNRFPGGALLPATAALMILALAPASIPAAQTGKTFPTPEDAAKALAEAGRKKDAPALVELFGEDSKDVINSGDEVLDNARLEQFSKRVSKVVVVKKGGPTTATICIGPESWPFPIPLVKGDAGWYFDTLAGREEVLNRFIGENEIRTMKALQTYVSAQVQYSMKDHDEDGVMEFAQKIKSSEGKKDGLYWPVQEGETPSPLGEFAREAEAEGYTSGVAGFHGYRYKVLTRQGKAAAGGAYDYLANGNMVGGFAVAAYPVEYGKTGIMTFVINRNGIIYQKDLGKDTQKLVGSMTAYNPDESWEEQ